MVHSFFKIEFKISDTVERQMSRKAGNRMMKTALQMLELIAFLSQFLEKNILYKNIKDIF